MKQERKALRIGVVLILLAAVWRVAAGGGLVPVAEFFRKPEVAAFIVYLGTGRVVHPEAQAKEETVPPAEGTHPIAPPETLSLSPPPGALLTAEDLAYFSLYDLSGRSFDRQQLLTQPLSWDLSGPEPKVLILHTHATESYVRGTQDYVETALYRTRDKEYNVVKVGAHLARQLEERGIGVIHDTTLHDYPSYTGSYNNSRKAAQDWMAQYPSLVLVLDLHRDAALNPDGSQMATRANVDGQDSAQLMLVVGSDASGLAHPNWQENMAIGAKLHVVLERSWKGLMRPICFRAERFNQDLLPGMLLVEVGTAGNTLQQALVAAECLAEGIAQLCYGAN